MDPQSTREIEGAIKKPFFDVFSVTQDEKYLYPNYKIQIGGVILNTGVHMSRGVTIAGIDFFDKKIWGRNLAVKEEENEVLNILGYYKS
jgi:hypothetical protein